VQSKKWLSKEQRRAAPLSGTSRPFVYAWLTAGMVAQPAGCSLLEIKMTSRSGSVNVEPQGTGLVCLRWQMIVALILDDDSLCTLLHYLIILA